MHPSGVPFRSPLAQVRQHTQYCIMRWVHRHMLVVLWLLHSNLLSILCAWQPVLTMEAHAVQDRARLSSNTYTCYTPCRAQHKQCSSRLAEGHTTVCTRHSSPAACASSVSVPGSCVPDAAEGIPTVHAAAMVHRGVLPVGRGVVVCICNRGEQLAYISCVRSMPR